MNYNLTAVIALYSEVQNLSNMFILNSFFHNAELMHALIVSSSENSDAWTNW